MAYISWGTCIVHTYVGERSESRGKSQVGSLPGAMIALLRVQYQACGLLRYMRQRDIQHIYTPYI